MKPLGRATHWVFAKSHGVRYCRNPLCCGWSIKPYKRAMSKARRRDLTVQDKPVADVGEAFKCK